MLNFQPILMMCFVVSYPNLTFLSYSFSNKQDTTQNRLWNWTTCSQEFISWAEQQGHRQTFTWHLWLVEWAQLLKITKKVSFKTFLHQKSWPIWVRKFKYMWKNQQFGQKEETRYFWCFLYTVMRCTGCLMPSSSSKGLSKNQDSRGVHKSGYDFHRILSHYLIWVTFENVECKSNLTLKINLESLARYAFSV